MMEGNRHTSILNLSASYLLIWGAFVVSPYSQMFKSAPDLYKPMIEIVRSETFWGAFAIAIGVTSAYLGYRRRPSGSLLMFIAFSLFATLFFLGDLERPAWAAFGVVALFNLLQWRESQWTTFRNG
jgi:hypothetical protein